MLSTSGGLFHRRHRGFGVTQHVGIEGDLAVDAERNIAIGEVAFVVAQGSDALLRENARHIGEHAVDPEALVTTGGARAAEQHGDRRFARGLRDGERAIDREAIVHEADRAFARAGRA